MNTNPKTIIIAGASSGIGEATALACARAGAAVAMAARRSDRIEALAERIAQELQRPAVACPPPLAVSYRVGEPAPEGGRLLGTWRRPFAVGDALPTMPLPLSVHAALPVDLDQTYSRAAADAYLT